MDIKDIIKKLVDNNYPEKQAPVVAQELIRMDVKLVLLLEAWMKDGQETDFEAEGFSVVDFRTKYHMTYPAALLTMDWLLKEPVIAKEAISHGIK